MNHTKTAISLFLVIAAFGGRASAQVPPASGLDADSSANSKRADDLTHRGVALGEKERWTEAEPLLREAWKLKHSYDIAGNLGIAEAGLSKHRDAAEHLTFALRSFPANGKPEHRQLLEQTLARARLQVAAVTVRVNKEKADVLVDGRGVGISPLADAVFVDPGRRTFEAKLAGYEAAPQVIEAKKGDSTEVALVLKTPAPPPPPPGPPVKDVWRPGTAVLVTGGALAVGGLAAGAGLTVAANQKRADAGALAATLPAGGPVCAGTPVASVATTCTAVKNAAASRDALSRGAVAGFVLGGAFGLATAGLGWWTAASPKGERSGKPSVRVVPFAGATGGGLVVLGEL
jgi:hypothetical protein